MKHVRIIETHHLSSAKTGAVYIRAVDVRTGKSIRVPYRFEDSFAEHHAAAVALVRALSGRKRCITGARNGGSSYLFVFSNFSALYIRGDAKRADVDCARFYSSDPELRVIGCEVNWEDPELFCDITGARIESAYAEDLARDADLSRGFDAGNYDAAYVSTDYETALAKRGQRSEAYRAAYVLGFFSSHSYDEIGSDIEAFDEVLSSSDGQRCIELGYVDRFNDE